MSVRFWTTPYDELSVVRHALVFDRIAFDAFPNEPYCGRYAGYEARVDFEMDKYEENITCWVMLIYWITRDGNYVPMMPQRKIVDKIDAFVAAGTELLRLTGEIS